MENEKISGELAKCRQLALIKIDECMTQLVAIYREVGYSPDDWPKLIQQSWSCACGAVIDELENERSRRRSLTDKVETVGRRVLFLAGQLDESVPEPDEKLTLLQLDKFLETHHTRLTRTRDRLRDQIRPLKEKEAELCEILGEQAATVCDDVPRQQDFAALEQNINQLQLLRASRRDQLITVRQRVARSLQLLEQEPSSGDAQELIEKSADDFGLTEERVQCACSLAERLEKEHRRNHSQAEQLSQQLTQLWNKLEVEDSERALAVPECPDLSQLTAELAKPSLLDRLKLALEHARLQKLERLDVFIGKLRAEIDQLYQSSCFSADQCATFAATLAQTEFTESLLAEHESELERVRQYWEQRSDVLQPFHDHQRMWCHLVVLQDKVHDPNRFSNRGGNLLLEERERKSLERKLPKIRDDIIKQAADFEKTTGEKILLYGVCVEDFFANQEQERSESLQREREMRAVKKKTQIQQETMYGSRPATPSVLKRRLAAAEGHAATPLAKHSRMESTRIVGTRTPLTNNTNTRIMSRLAGTAPLPLDTRQHADENAHDTTNYSDFRRGLQRRLGANANTCSEHRGWKPSPVQLHARRLRRRSLLRAHQLPAASPVLRSVARVAQSPAVASCARR